MLLSSTKIQEEIDAGHLVFDPALDSSQIHDASVDLTLDNKFRVFEHTPHKIELLEETSYRDVTKEIVTDRLLLRPQETVLGVTKEQVKMPDYLCGWLEGRSRFARLGLLIHISAGLIHPGVENKQVLEITNLSPNILELVAGQRICQLAFQRVEGASKYSGIFSTQDRA